VSAKEYFTPAVRFLQHKRNYNTENTLIISHITKTTIMEKNITKVLKTCSTSTVNVMQSNMVSEPLKIRNLNIVVVTDK
jgi:hypothetical protein